MMIEPVSKKEVILTSLPKQAYRSFFKPLIDWFIALIAVIILSPFMIIIGLAIKLDSRGSIFFVQDRLGLNGKKFRIIKFRSMTAGNKANSTKLYKDDPRITKIGSLLRKTSIDEVPQLFNILLGQMSFIGPRPPVPHFPKQIEEYTPHEYQRFLVIPGISGLAQIRCREVHDWDINIEIDIEYVHNISFIYDFKLFIKSLGVFLKTDNIYRQD